MDNFRAAINHARRLENGDLATYWLPENMELQDVTNHGQQIPVLTSVAEALASYEKTAAIEMMKVVDRVFPGLYTLDPKYINN